MPCELTSDMLPAHCRCETVVLGCGNWLFGDDGFGPAVVSRLAEMPDLPPRVCALDVGTSAREVLFDILLGPERPRRVVVVDAVDLGREPGGVWAIQARDLPEIKLDDFSMHQVPTSNLLRELNDLAGVDVTCVAGQVTGFPPEVKPGLSAPMRRAVDRAVSMVLDLCRRPCGKRRPAAHPLRA
jgi:coenzyme F420 hydrogenase subunit delta